MFLKCIYALYMYFTLENARLSVKDCWNSTCNEKYDVKGNKWKLCILDFTSTLKNGIYDF